MADDDFGIEELDRLAAKLGGLTAEHSSQIQSAGLRAVNAYVVPALKSVTPVSVGPFGATSLAPGALKAAAKGTILQDEDGSLRAVAGFGRLHIFAERVDAGTSKTAANPFVRSLADSPGFQEKAQEEFLAGAEAAVERILSDE